MRSVPRAVATRCFLPIIESVEASRTRSLLLSVLTSSSWLPISRTYFDAASIDFFFYTIAHLMTLFHAALMFIAAFFAGVVNSIAGGGTLLTFPLLIWLGLDPKVANATSTVALWPGLFGGLFGYRREMDDSSLMLMRLGVISIIGGGVGAWLLIVTPSPVFARLVPLLILFATVLFTIQKPVNRWLHLPATGGEPITTTWWMVATVIQFFSAMYGGYFGAGNGILMLAVLGMLGLHNIHRANGVKNFLGVCINSLPLVGFFIMHLGLLPTALRI